MATVFSLENLLVKVAHNRLDPQDVLSGLSRDDLERILKPSFQTHGDVPLLGKGRGILAGDVAGALVLNQQVADDLIAEAQKRGTRANYIYSIPEGDIQDFLPLKHCRGFFTSNLGRTTWASVQAVSDGVPAIIAVSCEYVEDPSVTREVAFQLADASEVVMQLPRRFIRFRDAAGTTTEVEEGTPVSISGATGEIHLGLLANAQPVIGRVYQLLLGCYGEAVERYGFAAAWDRLMETSAFEQAATELQELINHPIFVGFQIVKQFAMEHADLKVLATAHTPEGVAETRLFAANITFNDGLRIEVNTEDYGVGLLRDERIWVTPEQIDVLRLVLLGADVLGEDRYREIQATYLEMHTEALYRVLAAGTGSVAVARILCMPYNKFFPDGFDSAEFAAQHDLSAQAVTQVVRLMSGERETYHGCRGMRLFCQREDVAELWVTALLNAAKRVHEEGTPIRLRVLLAMITLPEEGQMFLDLFDRVAPPILGDALPEIMDGVMCMLETSGSYIVLEELFSQSGQTTAIMGGLIGSNDFTTACLNFNRADAVRNIIPGYIAKGILPESPFQRIYEPVVGKAITSALRRSRTLSVKVGREYHWGLAGELAGDWSTVQWLTTNVAPLGLHYVSTPPENILAMVCAAAQASVAEQHYLV